MIFRCGFYCGHRQAIYIYKAIYVLILNLLAAIRFNFGLLALSYILAHTKSGFY